MILLFTSIDGPGIYVNASQVTHITQERVDSTRIHFVGGISHVVRGKADVIAGEIDIQLSERVD